MARLWEQIGDGAVANKTYSLKYTLRSQRDHLLRQLRVGTVVTKGSGVGSSQWSSTLADGDYTFCQPPVDPAP